MTTKYTNNKGEMANYIAAKHSVSIEEATTMLDDPKFFKDKSLIPLVKKAIEDTTIYPLFEEKGHEDILDAAVAIWKTNN
jgi:hypothetical protein